MRKRFTVYSDVTGIGTGDFMAEFDEEGKARAYAEAAWTPEVGYALHDNDAYPPLAVRPPTHPERDYIRISDARRAAGDMQ